MRVSKALNYFEWAYPKISGYNWVAQGLYSLASFSPTKGVHFCGVPPCGVYTQDLKPNAERLTTHGSP